MTEQEADEMLAQAIRQHAEVYDLCESGELLGDFAVIANWQASEANGTSSYTVAYHRQNVPDHIARGLFQTGLAHLDADDD